MPLPITSFTVSLEIADSVYGNGQKNFASFRAEAPSADGGVSLDEALDQSLDLHLKAWVSVLQARHMSKKMTAQEFADAVVRAGVRIEKARSILRDVDNATQA